MNFFLKRTNILLLIGQNTDGFQRTSQIKLNGNRKTALKDNGVYIITGGLGSIGYAMAEEIAAKVKAKSGSHSRTPIPDKNAWMNG